MSLGKSSKGAVPVAANAQRAIQNEKSIPLGLYIWSRIRQCGVGRIFGVPGDFNLNLLDYIYDVDGLEWVGSTNELNAAYATDGYARTKRGAGCLVTTHGVGELSAINGIAGSMTEQVKVIHVVGQTSRQQQDDHAMVHHNIGPTPDHQIFNKAASGFRCASAALWSEENAVQEIDRVLRECFIWSCPVYLYVPMDMVSIPVSAARLDNPLRLTEPRNMDAVNAAAAHIYQRLSQAKCPAIFVDHLVRQHNATNELRKLLDLIHIPIFSSPMGKSIVDEDHPSYVGIYNGVASQPGVRTVWTTCDLYLVLGNLPADTNTGTYTRQTPKERSIFVNAHDTSIGEQIFEAAPISEVLTALTKLLMLKNVSSCDIPPLIMPKPQPVAETEAIMQSWIWRRLAEFIESNDVVIGETGTSSFGFPMERFPAHCQWITQAYYGSIGYATPAAFGADVALRELASDGSRPRGRTLLSTGDGSLMLTVQEIGNMIKDGAAPIIFIINNNGYTIERAIHGAKKSYNDIPAFDYSQMLQFLGMDPVQASQSFHRVSTRGELDTVLRKRSVVQPQTVQIVEILLDQLDIPMSLSVQVAARGTEVVREMKEAGFKLHLDCDV